MRNFLKRQLDLIKCRLKALEQNCCDEDGGGGGGGNPPELVNLLDSQGIYQYDNFSDPVVTIKHADYKNEDTPTSSYFIDIANSVNKQIHQILVPLTIPLLPSDTVTVNLPVIVDTFLDVRLLFPSLIGEIGASLFEVCMLGQENHDLLDAFYVSNGQTIQIVFDNFTVADYRGDRFFLYVKYIK